MTTTDLNSWQAIHDEVQRRIHRRVWKPGEAIPNEADLALEFGCARATVNRALRALAEAGVLDRRRKAGTRVALHPVSRATLRIPIIRQEIEEQGAHYSYDLITQIAATPPRDIAKLAAHNRQHVHVVARHSANAIPLVIEDRWINPEIVPLVLETRFDAISANEWLIINAPYTRGEISFGAATAGPREAELLDIAPGAALFTTERLTWDQDRMVTQVQLFYAPGYRKRTEL